MSVYSLLSIMGIDPIPLDYRFGQCAIGPANPNFISLVRSTLYSLSNLFWADYLDLYLLIYQTCSRARLNLNPKLPQSGENPFKARTSVWNTVQEWSIQCDHSRNNSLSKIPVPSLSHQCMKPNSRMLSQLLQSPWLPQSHKELVII